MLLAFVLLAISSAKAKENWVVTLKNDTIYGKIGFVIRGAYEMDELTVKKGKEKHKFKPIELKRINKAGNEYVPLKIDGKYQFALVISEGYLSYYKFVNPDSNAYEDFSQSILTKMDGTSVQLSNIGFMKSVRKYLSDCQPLENKIKNSEYKPKDIDDVIIYYNEWIDSRSLKQEPENSVNLDQAALISSIISKVEADEELSKNSELLEMLNDVKGKIKNGKSVPGYLKNGVIDGLNGNESLTTEFNSLF